METGGGRPDPAAASGSVAECREALLAAMSTLKRRIADFTCLPVDSLDRLSLNERLQDIGALQRDPT